VGLFTAVFALSYNAVFILVVPAIAFIAFEKKDRNFLKCCWGGLVGILVGILANPYYPLQLEMLWLGLGIATRGFAGLVHGDEVAPLRSLDALSQFGFSIVISAVAVGLAFKNPALRFRAGVAGFFTVLLFFNGRAIDYLVATSLLCLPEVWDFLGRRRRILAGIVGLLVCYQAWGATIVREYYRDTPARNLEIPVYEAALSQIPAGAKVVNGDWGMGPYLFYLRPDLKILDALDPVLLALYAPDVSNLRMALAAGRELDWPKAMGDQFKSEYILTRNPKTMMALQKSGVFKILWAKQYATSLGGPESMVLFKYQVGSTSDR
jgi:hypothetical protein